MGCCSSHNEFANYTFDTTDDFSLIGQNVLARVVDIYDGDTCICVLKLFDKMFKFRIRLAGIDTCELKSANGANRLLALAARKRLYQLVTKDMTEFDDTIIRNDLREKLNSNSYIVRLVCDNFDKYGRLLCRVYDPDDIHQTRSYNNVLIDEHLAYEYNGKTKLTEEQQMELLQKP